MQIRSMSFIHIGYAEWESEEEIEQSGSDFEMDKSSRGKRKSIYAENSDEDESDEAWAPGKALKVRTSSWVR